MEHYYLNRKYKDRLFRFIFNDKENLLQLYNAINDSHYNNPDDLVITTIDDVVSFIFLPYTGITLNL